MKFELNCENNAYCNNNTIYCPLNWRTKGNRYKGIENGDGDSECLIVYDGRTADSNDYYEQYGIPRDIELIWIDSDDETPLLVNNDRIYCTDNFNRSCLLSSDIQHILYVMNVE